MSTLPGQSAMGLHMGRLTGIIMTQITLERGGKKTALAEADDLQMTSSGHR